MAITNTRGKITCLRPTGVTEVQLYVVPAATEVDAVLRVCNQHTAALTYGVARCDAAHGDVAANGADWIAYTTTTIQPNKPPHEYSIHAGPTETIRVIASMADKISFVLEGNLKVTS